MVVTILAGRRPEYLDITLSSLFRKLPYLRTEKFIGLVNGGDKPTQKIFKNYKLDYKITDTILPIGQAISVLADLALKSGEEYWLHIEDDWQTLFGGLDKAVAILDKNPKITQVRLRLAKEKVLPFHMITREPLKWQRNLGFDTAPAHFTFNPFLIRTKDIPKAFPCTGEKDCQRRWTGLSAQLKPGLFKHIGIISLRQVTRCEL